MADFSITPKTRLKRKPDRGHYDRATVYQIIDQALICHVGFVVGTQPFVIPTLHARQGDRLLLHGSPGSRLIQHIQAGHPISVSIALLDGFVLAKTVLNHSMNYRSVVLFGAGQAVTGYEEKLAALECLTEHLAPGRWQQARQPDGKDLNSTAVVAMDIIEASAKIRTGEPKDDPDFQGLDVWAGVVPIITSLGKPEPAAYCLRSTPFPDLMKYIRG